MFPNHVIHPIIRRALAEDVGSGDITTLAVLTGREAGTAQAVAKSAMVVAGLDVFEKTFHFFDPDIRFTACLPDGQKASRGEVLAEVSGKLQNILTAERVALNFFQRMCGIATTTRQYVEAVGGLHAKILDTRKTVPGLRILDKYAVRVGGGFNHRFALYDGILIKDNHLALAGGISTALARVREKIPHTLKVEVEVKNLGEVEEALGAGADVILLDNMTIPAMKAAVDLIGGRVPVEASGNVTLANVRQIAEVGVNFISVGALTHSVTAADISLLIREIN
ncbi:MAG: carboxylating nicotinate-nucleotide diphosphorylase [Deltaproteobacteria bacterium]|nr:carboxylating nicotinate-nucleotide diphosphorylase [Deltaproteobacteria bacterium]